MVPIVLIITDKFIQIAQFWQKYDINQLILFSVLLSMGGSYNSTSNKDMELLDLSGRGIQCLHSSTELPVAVSNHSYIVWCICKMKWLFNPFYASQIMNTVPFSLGINQWSVSGIPATTGSPMKTHGCQLGPFQVDDRKNMLNWLTVKHSASGGSGIVKVLSNWQHTRDGLKGLYYKPYKPKLLSLLMDNKRPFVEFSVF